MPRTRSGKRPLRRVLDVRVEVNIVIAHLSFLGHGHVLQKADQHVEAKDFG